MVEEALFRSNKRRKVFRKKDNDDDHDTSDAIDTTNVLTSSEPRVHDSDAEDAVSNALKLARRKTFARNHGIAFAAAAPSARDVDVPEGTTLTVYDAGQIEPVAQVDRFVKPTGRVGVVEDKHLTAYIDSKLAEARAKQGSSLRDQPSQNLSASPVHEDDRSDGEDIEDDQADEADRRPSAQGPGHIVPIPRSSKSRRAPRRSRVPEHDLTADARAAMVDAIMRESEVKMYDRSRESGPKLRPTRVAPASAEGVDELFNAMDNDEAAAESFKAEFLAGLAERKSRRPPPAAPARNAAPSQGITPKLGGSRAQREKMRAAVAEAAGKPTGTTKK